MERMIQFLMNEKTHMPADFETTDQDKDLLFELIESIDNETPFPPNTGFLFCF